MAGGLALFQSALRDRLKYQASRSQLSTQGFLIHMRDHQHVARFGIGNDSRDQAVGVELGFERQAFFDVMRG